MATVFILAVASVKGAYDTYLSTNATITAARVAIAALGAQPQPPTNVVIDSDWNQYVTLNETWLANMATAQGTLTTCINNTRIAELAVIRALGYASGDIPDSICLDQWVKVVGAGGGILTYTNWIGASVKSTYLTISTSQPLQEFPNI